MSDRPAPPSQPPAPPRTPTQARPRPVLPPAPTPDGAATAATSATSATAGPAPASPATGSGDTAVRVGLAERIQAKLAAATGSGDGSSSKDAVAAAPSPTPARKARARGPRRARLRLTRIDPWSVMKTAFLLSIAIGVVTVVAVAMIWEVIGAAGVWTSINDTVKEVIDEPGTADFDIEDYVGTDRVVGFSMLVAAVNVVLITAIATLAAFLYNMSAALLGGIEVTLAEDA